jgi:hypothetical protein
MLVEQRMLIENIHEEIGHFGEMWTLVEVKKRFFWHDRTKCRQKCIVAGDKWLGMDIMCCKR